MATTSLAAFPTTTICSFYGEDELTCRCAKCLAKGTRIALEIHGAGWFYTTEERLARNLARGRKNLITAALNQYEGMRVEDPLDVRYGKTYTRAFFARYNNRTLAFIADNL